MLLVESNDNNYSKLFLNKIQSGIKEEKIFDYDSILNTFKEKINSLEKKLNFFFKDVVLIIDNFDCSLISFSGFKNLNGSQLMKENITYILNSLKLKINEVENKKTILHILRQDLFLIIKK